MLVAGAIVGGKTDRHVSPLHMEFISRLWRLHSTTIIKIISISSMKKKVQIPCNYKTGGPGKSGVTSEGGICKLGWKDE